MSFQGFGLLVLPIVANGTIGRYRGVGFDQAQATVAGQKILGFSRRAAVNGNELDITSLGTACVETGGAFAAGVALAVDSSGRVVQASSLAVAVGTLAVSAGGTAMTSTSANGAVINGVPALSGGDPPQFIVGYSLPGQASSAAGQFMEILVR
jgi:hypothetical protein